MLPFNQHFHVIILITSLYYNFPIFSCNKEVCYKNEECFSETTRYIFYDINPPEGFNLRRDVYLRFSLLAYKLKQSSNKNLNKFKLVLPPWSHLMHWKYREEPEQIPWSFYFDLNSLKKFAPVIEMHEFFDSIERKYSKVEIDEVYVLQHFEDMFETGNFEDRMQIDKCHKHHSSTFFYYNNVTSNNVKCLSFHGAATNLADLLAKSKAKTILLDHAEVALHDMFGNKLYWKARRSMRFNTELREVAEEFRRQFLNSTNQLDNTLLPDDWQMEKPRRNAKGGSYLAVHLRRNDFLRGRAKDSPTLESVAKQIDNLLQKLQLNNVFIATDSPQEFHDLVNIIPSKYKIFKYTPTDDIKSKFKDGGVAIIDQIICSYARYFIGTHESTFSFRIQEEREILGFATETTFNSLCKDDTNCKKPSIWEIVY